MCPGNVPCAIQRKVGEEKGEYTRGVGERDTEEGEQKDEQHDGPHSEQDHSGAGAIDHVTSAPAPPCPSPPPPPISAAHAQCPPPFPLWRLPV